MTAGFIIGRSSQRPERVARSSKAAWQFPSQAAAVHRHFCPLGQTDDEQGNIAGPETAGLARFPAAAHAPAPSSRIPVRLDAKLGISISPLKVDDTPTA